MIFNIYARKKSIVKCNFDWVIFLIQMIKHAQCVEIKESEGVKGQ